MRKLAVSIITAQLSMTKLQIDAIKTSKLYSDT